MNFWSDIAIPKSHPSTLKHISDKGHDFVKEYRSDDKRHVALQSPTHRYRNTPPWQKRAAASTTCLRLRRAGKLITTLLLPLNPFLRFSPPYKHHYNMFKTGSSRARPCFRSFSNNFRLVRLMCLKSSLMSEFLR
ncbi:hypothetical protein TNCV_2053021 [Trichonephila clavipes]|nr:hypothetical protein TNCV_2053021 [Trichonephila clavipes]